MCEHKRNDKAGGERQNTRASPATTTWGCTANVDQSRPLLVDLIYEKYQNQCWLNQVKLAVDIGNIPMAGCDGMVGSVFGAGAMGASAAGSRIACSVLWL